jgi:dolichol-phosphate mannosyltransferase
MIGVLLCAWNEADAVGRLVEELEATLRTLGPHLLILVDDGSRDGTAERARAAAQVHGAPLVVLTHPENRGLGAALATGFEWAASHLVADDALVTMDADNTHPPSLVADLLRALDAGHDVVIASRFHPGARQRGVPLHRRWLSSGARHLAGRLAPVAGARDVTCGYRAYRVGALARARARGAWPLSRETGFAAMLDVLLALDHQGVRVAEVPLDLRYDARGGASKMRLGPTLVRTLGVMLRRRLRGPGGEAAA